MTLADPYRDYQIDYSAHEQTKAQEQQSQLVYEADQQQATLHHGGRPGAAFISSGHTSQYQSQPQQHPLHRSPHQQHQQHQQHPQHHQASQQQPQHSQSQQPSQPSHGPGAVLMPSPSQHGVVRDLQQQPVMIPTPMVPPQLPPHFSSTSLPLPYPGDRHGVKRRRADDGRSGGSDETASGIGLSMLPESSHADEQHSSEMLLPTPGDHSSHHPHALQHDYHQTSPIHQQHHHHRLPSQATLAAVQGSDGELTSPGGGTGSQSVVGQPGMPDPAPRPRGPKLKFTPEDDSLLVELKENRNLTWKQIAEFFPGRTSGTLQVRYCTKLRAKATVWTDEAVCPFALTRAFPIPVLPLTFSVPFPLFSKLKSTGH